MKNVYLIPTDKPSRLHLGDSGLVLCDLNFGRNTINGQNIYITNSEKPKDGDWCFGMDGIFQYKGKVNLPDVELPKKIILTTDQDLIADGVQAIDDEFLQWFVTNQSCEDVEVKRNYLGSKCLKCGFIENHDEVDTENCPKCSNTTYEHFYEHKTIIPQENPKNTCPKCRTTDFDNCHSIKCPMRKEKSKQEINMMFKYIIGIDPCEKEEPKTNLDRLPFPELIKEFAEYYKNVPLVEEPKQETIEDAAERMYPINSTGGVMEMLNKHQLNNSYKQEGFIAGAKSDATREYWYKKFWEDYNSQFKNQKDGDH
jgi:hypothetical protein